MKATQRRAVFYFACEVKNMGLLQMLGIRSRDDPQIIDSVRDSGQTFTFGKADSGVRVDEKSAMQITMVYACVRLLAETVAELPLHLYWYSDANGNSAR